MSTKVAVVTYQTSAGKRPFDEWMETLRRRDLRASNAIDSRIERIRDYGNFGDYRSVGHGIFELRIHFGPGFRVYYSLKGQQMAILLSGGEKSDQRHDIQKAHDYVADFRRRA